MIVPAGNKMPDWSPKATKMQKLASDGQEVQDQEVDPLLEAAKGFVEAGKEEVKEASEEEAEIKEASDCGEMAQDDSVVLDVVEDEVGDNVEDVVEDEAPAQSVSEAVAEVEAKAEEAEEVVAQVEEAIEKIEEAVQEVREVASGVDDAVDEVSDEEVVDEDGVDAIPGEEVVDTEVIVESSPCDLAAETEEGMDKSAASEEFCKFAKLSPQNRKKLSNYWTNMLGYPRDYVNLMTKDYEK